MDELLKFLAEKGTELSPNTLILLSAFYFIVWKDLRMRLTGLSSYFKKFLAIQNGRKKATQDLAGAIRALCRQVANVDSCDDCEACR